jgi:hypothetical protein
MCTVVTALLGRAHNGPVGKTAALTETLINAYVHEMQTSRHTNPQNSQNMEAVNHANTVTNDTSHITQLHS